MGETDAWGHKSGTPGEEEEAGGHVAEVSLNNCSAVLISDFATIALQYLVSNKMGSIFLNLFMAVLVGSAISNIQSFTIPL